MKSAWSTLGIRRLAIASLVIVAGCDPEFVFQGRLVDPEGRPVQNAKITLTCDGADQDSTVSDASGHFHAARVGAFGDACALVVRRITGATTSFPILQHCTKPYRRGTCTEVTLNGTVP